MGEGVLLLVALLMPHAAGVADTGRVCAAGQDEARHTGPTLAAADEIPRILYINRCMGGCSLQSGGTDSRTDTSALTDRPVTLAEFDFEGESWADMMACVDEQFFPFFLQVTDVDPGNVPHFEIMVAGENTDLNLPGAAGVAPFACAGVDNGLGFTFAYTIGNNPRALCETTAHEAGHLFGLEHAYLCEDPMTYLDGCGEKSFQNEDTACGEGQPGPCSCGATQNSVQHLLGMFGPGQRPATVELEVVAIREAPESSNGDGVVTPGEHALVEVAWTNRGNLSAVGGLLDVHGTGLKAVDGTEMPEVPGASRLTHEVEISVGNKACARDVEITVAGELEGQTATATARFVAGITQLSVDEAFATAAGWIIDEAAGDTATQGQWEFGVPRPTFFAGRNIQPRGGPDGISDPVWMTGIGGEWDVDQLVGATSITSTPIDVDAWYTVTHIRYNLWYLALDRPNQSLEPSQAPHLIVELSSDGGAHWTVVDEVVSEPLRWEQREVPIAGFKPTGDVRIRFTATNDASTDSRLVEVGIDSVSLLGGELLCDPPSSGCRASTGSGTAGVWLCLALLALGRMRRRDTATGAPTGPTTR